MKLTMDQEKKLVGAFLDKIGVPEDDAVIVRDLISHSDFTGVYSHGLSRFIGYLKQFETGAINKAPKIKPVNQFGAVVTYDCDHASGLVAVNRVYDDVVERAKEHGIAIGAAFNASNIGCGSYYAWRAAKDNMLAILMCNTRPSMAPFGGADKLLGTNPIVMASPAGEEYPMILDISTSVVAMGKVISYRREGKEMPLGWANDINGVPTTDAKEAYAVTPIGSYKGSGLAMFVEIFSGLLTGANFSYQIKTTEAAPCEDTGFSLILVDIYKFMPIEEYKKRADEFIHDIKNSKKATGVKEIFMPGELEFKLHEKSLMEGLDVSDATCEELRQAAVKWGMLGENEPLSKLYE